MLNITEIREAVEDILSVY